MKTTYRSVSFCLNVYTCPCRCARVCVTCLCYATSLFSLFRTWINAEFRLTNGFAKPDTPFFHDTLYSISEPNLRFTFLVALEIVTNCLNPFITKALSLQVRLHFTPQVLDLGSTTSNGSVIYRNIHPR